MIIGLGESHDENQIIIGMRGDNGEMDSQDGMRENTIEPLFLDLELIPPINQQIETPSPSIPSTLPSLSTSGMDSEPDPSPDLPVDANFYFFLFVCELKSDSVRGVCHTHHPQFISTQIMVFISLSP